MKNSRFLSERPALISALFTTALLWGCSGRVVVREASEQEGADKPKLKTSKTSEADAIVNVETDSTLGISLVSPPPTETMSGWFVSSVDGPQDSTYRYALVHGTHNKCESWADFLAVNEPLRIDLGADGAKTLCIQGKDKEGTLGKVLVMNFHKKSAPADGPEYTLHGKPSEFTSASSARIFVNSGDGIQYRYLFVSSATCKTLESEQWRSIKKPIENINFKHDGVWSLCLEIRDKFGNKNKTPHKYSWTRDTVYPVLDELPVPIHISELDELTFNITGNQVFEYQYALINDKLNCSQAEYSAFRSATLPLTINTKSDGTQMLCILSRSESGLLQQQPYMKIIRKLKLKAEVKIEPVAVSKSTSGVIVAKSENRKFVISGSGVTHYKALSLDRSDSCDNQTAPTSAPVPVSTSLEASFSPGNIKTLCVWGFAISSDGTQSAQEIPTHVRFFNDTIETTAVTNQGAKPLSLAQAVSLCSSCHELKNEADFQNHAIQIATRLRDKDNPHSMPAGGWKDDHQRTGIILFLYSLPGYPQDLSQSLQ